MYLSRVYDAEEEAGFQKKWMCGKNGKHGPAFGKSRMYKFLFGGVNVWGCPLETGHVQRGIEGFTRGCQPTSVPQCVGDYKPPEATVMGGKETPPLGADSY